MQLVAVVEKSVVGPGRWPNFAAPRPPQTHLVWPTLCRLYDRREALAMGVPTLLYVIREQTGLVKIGTALDPVSRLRNLQVANPHPLVLVGTVPATVALERFIHAEFAAERVRGEWFQVTPRLRAFFARLESANEIHVDVVEAGYFPDCGDTIACLVGIVEDVLYRHEQEIA